jgi:hypothetical protein
MVNGPTGEPVQNSCARARHVAEGVIAGCMHEPFHTSVTTRNRATL